MFVCLSVPRKQIFGLNSTTEWLFFGGLNGSFSDLRCEPEWKRSHNLVLPTLLAVEYLKTMIYLHKDRDSTLWSCHVAISNLCWWKRKNHFQISHFGSKNILRPILLPYDLLIALQCLFCACFRCSRGRSPKVTAKDGYRASFLSKFMVTVMAPSFEMQNYVTGCHIPNND